MSALDRDLAGPVRLHLVRAVEQVPAESAMRGGCRYELKWDGFIH